MNPVSLKNSSRFNELMTREAGLLFVCDSMSTLSKRACTEAEGPARPAVSYECVNPAHPAFVAQVCLASVFVLFLDCALSCWNISAFSLCCQPIMRPTCCNPVSPRPLTWHRRDEWCVMPGSGACLWWLFCKSLFFPLFLADYLCI